MRTYTASVSLLILIFTSFAGCLGASPKVGAVMSEAEPTPAGIGPQRANQVPSGNGSPSETPEKEKPVVFRGAILLPDPSQVDTGHCHGYGSSQALTARYTRNDFQLDGNQAGWTFHFDVGGLGAYFSTPGKFTPIAPTGIVPENATALHVCTRTAANVFYELILSPPGTRAVFRGHVIAPDPAWNDQHRCQNLGGLYTMITGHVSSERFEFSQAFGGWSFRFDTEGLAAQFYGGEGDSARVHSAGTVPTGSLGAWACSTAAFNTDFHLILSRPV